MGIRGKKPAAVGKKPVEEAVAFLWIRERVVPVVPAVPVFHRSCPPSVHRCGYISYPSMIFLRISPMLRLNSASSFIMASIRPQAEMAVVWSERSKRMAIRL